MNSSDEEHLVFLRIALACAKECNPTPTAFCVGCVITVPNPNSPASSPIILSTGYSRELEGNTHAEANALTKARDLSSDVLESLGFQTSDSIDDLLAKATVYTTMEPCSTRLSGLPPCTNALISARVKECIIGVGEPTDFVQCEGARKLEDAGIEVVWLNGLEQECLEVARRGH